MKELRRKGPLQVSELTQIEERFWQLSTEIVETQIPA